MEWSLRDSRSAEAYIQQLQAKLSEAVAQERERCARIISSIHVVPSEGRIWDVLTAALQKIREGQS